MSYRFVDNCEQDQDGTVPSWSCSQAVSKPVWHIPLLCVQWKTPDDGQRSCPKHAEFYSKNEFEKLVYLVGFIIWIHWRYRPNSRRRNQKTNHRRNHPTSHRRYHPMTNCISKDILRELRIIMTVISYKLTPSSLAANYTYIKRNYLQSL